jgi:hypothetical protein
LDHGSQVDALGEPSRGSLAGTFLPGAFFELLGAADWTEHSRILLILQFPFVSSAAIPSTGHNKLDSQFAEDLRQTGSGGPIAVVLDALRIIARPEIVLCMMKRSVVMQQVNHCFPRLSEFPRFAVHTPEGAKRIAAFQGGDEYFYGRGPELVSGRSP